MISVKDQIKNLNERFATKSNVKESSTHLVNDVKNVEHEVIEVQDRKALYILQCENCVYTVQGRPIKISVENCKNVTLKIEGKVLTGTVDVWKGENITMEFETCIAVLQLDNIQSITIKVPEAEYFGSMFWAGVEDINLHFGEEKHTLNYGDLQKKNPELESATGQFKTTVALDGSLKTQAMVRLESGYPATLAEEQTLQRQQQKKEEVLRGAHAEEDD
ncbi:hypothetical protein EC968_009910 [Mortierella alpina]|nr:hypothetical protein EC968_009910 [Mortierella alpina]